MNALKVSRNRESERQKEIIVNGAMKRFNRELNKQTANQVRVLAKDIMAMLLFAVGESEGYGKKRLLRIGNRMQPLLDELVQHYEMTEDDTTWLCRRMLSQNYGIEDSDIEGMLRIGAKVENELQQ